jgi:rSAM/selenodomain-associated transferase 2
MISVVVPALDEEEEIAATLASAADPAVLEVIVVDGGSRDATAEIARRLGHRVLTGPRGRALQMNAGAAVARGDVLLFLHADTRLPAGFGAAIEGAVARGAVAGRFDVVLRGRHPWLRVVAALMNARSRATRIATGDQAIFVRRDAFDAMGGFAAIPLMEDIELSRRLRAVGPYAALRARVSTSARRWEENGVARTVLLMWRLRFAYFCGVPAERLAQRYRRHGASGDRTPTSH